MNDDLLTQFRSAVPAPDDATARRIYVQATRGRSVRVPPRRLAVALVFVVVATLALVPIGGASLGVRVAREISNSFAPPPNQPALDQAAGDAESIASGYYTDARVNDAANKVELYMRHAPQSVIDKLNAAHPGIYAIHNDVGHTLAELLRLQRSILSLPLKTRAGVAKIWTSYPTADGYLKVGIGGYKKVRAAQAALDSRYGPGIIKVFGGAGPAIPY